jgi:ribonucleoside-diphosphate reductase alpha chain
MNKYTYDQAYEKALEYFNDEIAANVWVSKYAMKDSDGNYYELTPNDMHKRLAKGFNKIDTNYRSLDLKLEAELYNDLSEEGKKFYNNGLSEDKIFELIEKFGRIIPQGSVMSQLGHQFSIGSLSNCTVVGSPHDSYNGILHTDLQLANLMKRRAGVGVDLSTLRPDGAAVSNAAGSSTGAVSFMNRYSHTTNEVSQNGRRGALMLSLDVNHISAAQFATIKNDSTKVTGANISLRISDEFMECVKNDSDFLHIFPIDADKSIYKLDELEYNKITKIDGVYVKKIKAKSLWDIIIKSARDHAEPGLLFWDRLHWYSPSSVYPQYKNISTNPCGEISMGKSESCRLISTNMFSHVDNPFTPQASFNYEKWSETIYYAMVMNDYLVDLEIESIDKILSKLALDPEPDYIKEPEIKLWEDFKKVGEEGRRTGVGLTGLGDTLAALGLPYDSDEALKVTEEIMKVKLRAEFNASIDLAIMYGSFEGFDPKIEDESHFVQMLKEEHSDIYNRMIKHGRRNVSISTVAPGGSLSILANNITSGIEPLFMPYYTRRKKINPNDTNTRIDFKDKSGNAWQEFAVIHPNLKKWIVTQDPSLEGVELKVNQIQKLYEKSPYFGSTAHDINWVKRVELQSIVGKYISHSISSTLNLPNDVKNEEVAEIYMKSWEMGLKGVTVYRDGSREGVIIDSNDKNAENTLENLINGGIANFRDADRIIKVQAPKRPNKIRCEIYNVTAKGQRWTVLVGMLKEDPYEVWAYMNNGTDVKQNEGYVEKVKKGSYTLLDRNGDVIVKNLCDLMSDEEENLTRQISLSLRTGADMKFVVHSLNKSKGTIVSFAKAISRTLTRYVDFTEDDYSKMDKKCPSCEDPDGLKYDNGCVSCKSCGHSKCS